MRTNAALVVAVVVGLLTPVLGVQRADAHAAEAPISAPRPPETPVRHLTDEHGRALVLHGMNNGHSAKESRDALPWTGEAEIAAEVRKLGSNAVRLLVFWARVEPSPGRYDESYLDAVAERVRWYGKHGVHVVLDMHQDTWGPAVAGSSPNNGAPRWASHFDGLPATAQTPWELTYLQPGVVRAFDHFWGTTGAHPELARHFVAMWEHVARRFAHEDAVLGYDLFNEPLGGTSVWPFFERDRLTPFYQQVIDAVRRADDRRWILVEPQALGVNWGLPSALGAVTDPRQGPPRIAYAPHLYPVLVTAGQPYTGLTRVITRDVVERWRRANTEVARRLGTPLLLAEFGLNATVDGALDYVDDVTAMADRTGSGWLYWSNDPGGWGPHAPGGGWAPLAERLARPYPRAIAGEPVRWDDDGSALAVVLRPRPDVRGPTELFLPRSRFPTVPVITCGVGCSVAWDAERQVAAVTLGRTEDIADPVTITARAR
ncbi:cellulase family glycosylhydrolase [Streptoalloteichus hindustanus]|uniref:Endoglycosylceramidase n=1 Tax=Streptoalloteichus hindustanus TaxID=2017 RepID=A0A1M5GL89_STRHI|nr:cellulase family glycosylhydrolase [Streptoalloteichus hindustanus]SHG04458.1 endoglycosylceramidase [Streptoalloteichus hindustanus]